jgi:iron complex transport system substrate-binding protein
MTSRPTRRALTAVTSLLLLGGLTACGTTDSGADAAAAAAESSPTATTEQADAATGPLTSCAADDTTTSTGPVSLTDALGRTIELDQPAQRVAVLEWGQTESLLTLCVSPVAVADVEGYTTWDTAEPLPDGVADVGTRGEPNLDALFRAEPDLIVIEASGGDDSAVEQFADYDVPVLATAGADTADPIGTMTDTFELIAQATGREERADVVLDELDTHLDASAEAIAAAQPPTTGFVYFDGYVDGGNVALRPFGQGSLVGELGERLGLTNAWTGKVDELYGLGQSDIEGMSTVGDAVLLRTGTYNDSGDLTEALEGNPVWERLPAVSEGRSVAFAPGIWTFGGPASAVQLADAYVAAYSG